MNEQDIRMTGKEINKSLLNIHNILKNEGMCYWIEPIARRFKQAAYVFERTGMVCIYCSGKLKWFQFTKKKRRKSFFKIIKENLSPGVQLLKGSLI